MWSKAEAADPVDERANDGPFGHGAASVVRTRPSQTMARSAPIPMPVRSG